MKRTHARIAAPVIALALVAVGCGDDDGGDGTAAPGETGATTTPGDTSETTGTEVISGDTTTPDTGDEVQTGESLLDSVKSAGSVRCGVRDDLPGFSSVDQAGDHVGFDADFCRVIAAAVLGDAEAVEFVDTTTENRFTAVQGGEIDVLVAQRDVDSVTGRRRSD